MKMRAFNHLNLVVSDVERAAEFYESVFGMEREWQIGDFIFLRCGDADLALVGGKPEFHRKFHFGFRLRSRQEVDRWLEHVKGLSVPVVHGPKDYGEYYTFSCQDPDGYSIEIYHETSVGGRRTPER